MVFPCFHEPGFLPVSAFIPLLTIICSLVSILCPLFFTIWLPVYLSAAYLPTCLPAYSIPGCLVPGSLSHSFPIRFFEERMTSALPQSHPAQNCSFFVSAEQCLIYPIFCSSVVPRNDCQCPIPDLPLSWSLITLLPDYLIPNPPFTVYRSLSSISPIPIS
jgi:hypothetical protein